MKEKQYGTERKRNFSFPSPECFSHRQNRDEMPMNR